MPDVLIRRLVGVLVLGIGGLFPVIRPGLTAQQGQPFNRHGGVGSQPYRSANVISTARWIGWPLEVNVSSWCGLNVTRGRPATSGLVFTAATRPTA
jgi:hypothetical protein